MAGQGKLRVLIKLQSDVNLRLFSFTFHIFSQNTLFSLDGFPYMVSCKEVDRIEQRSDALDCSRVEVNRYVAPDCVKKTTCSYWDDLDVSNKSRSHNSDHLMEY